MHIMLWIYVIFKDIFCLLLVILTSVFSFFPLKWTDKKRDKTPVLLVHGYFNFSSVWLYFAPKLYKKTGCNIYTINLKNPLKSIEEYAKLIEQKAHTIEKIEKRSDLILIGHSMGGLICLYYTLFLAKEGSISKIITIGSPLKGTKMAAIALGKCGRQMKRGSDFIKKVNEAFLKKKPKEIFHIATDKDTLVIPYQSCFLSEDKESRFLIKNIGHIEMLYCKKILKKIIYWVRSTDS